MRSRSRDRVCQALPPDRSHLLRSVQMHALKFSNQRAQFRELLIRDVTVVQDQRLEWILLPVE